MKEALLFSFILYYQFSFSLFSVILFQTSSKRSFGKACFFSVWIMIGMSIINRKNYLEYTTYFVDDYYCFDIFSIKFKKTASMRLSIIIFPADFDYETVG